METYVLIAGIAGLALLMPAIMNAVWRFAVPLRQEELADWATARRHGATHMLIIWDMDEHEYYPITAESLEQARGREIFYRSKPRRQVVDIYVLTEDGYRKLQPGEGQ